MMTFAFLANTTSEPQLATFGLGAVVLMLAAIVLFLTPTALASSEMGAAWPRTGGIYVWTRLAFGETGAFIIIWLEWVNYVVAWPSFMATIAAQTTYAFNPDLSDNPAFIVVLVLVVTWAASLISMRGIRVAKGFSVYSAVAGSIVPALIMIGFAIAYLMQGNPMQMDLSAGSLIPDLDFTDIAFITGVLVMFSGIEVSAIHAGDVNNPGKTIPRSNLIAVGLCFLVFAPLTLAISTVIPADQINIVAGLVQSGQVIFDAVGAPWMIWVFCFLLVSGFVTLLVQILNGPSRGLVVAGREGGNLPPFLHRENRFKMPVVIIVVQAVISSVLSMGYFFLGSVQNAWFMFALVQGNMVLIMYIIMLAAMVKLRYSQPDANRPFKVPGKLAGVWAVACIGIIVCIIGAVISLFPTSEAEGMSTPMYVLLVGLGSLVMAAMPLVFWLFRKPSWKVESLDLNAPDPEAETV